MKKKLVEKSSTDAKSQRSTPTVIPDRVIVTTPIVGSGTFIRMFEDGTLPQAMPLVEKHQKIGEHLAEINAKLRACNDPAAWPEFARYCALRHRDTSNELRILAGRLERQKRNQLKKLRKTEMQLAETEPALAESLRNREYPPPQVPVSLVPKSAVQNPEVALRDKFIVRHHERTGREICRLLDEQIDARKLASDCLPAAWTKDCGVRSFVDAYNDNVCRPRVQKLISTAKKKYSGAYLEL